MSAVAYRKLKATLLPLLLAVMVGASCSPNVTPKEQTPIPSTPSQELTLEQALINGKPTLAEFGANT